MKDFTKQMKEMKGDNSLKNSVIEYVIDRYSDDEEIKTFFSDLLQHGCQSGMVGSLIYYTDTVKFYNDHKEEINTLLYEMLDQTGFNSPIDLFGDKWDEEDPLAIEQMNQNLLAWFGFEESARVIAEQLGIEI